MGKMMANDSLDSEWGQICMDVLRRANRLVATGRRSDGSVTAKWAMTVPTTGTPHLSQYRATRVNDWRANDPANEFDVLEPLIEGVFRQSSVAWCGMGIRRVPVNGAGSRPAIAFEYWARDSDVLQPAFCAQQLAGFMAANQLRPSYQILLTSSLCLNELDDGRLLQLYRTSVGTAPTTSWNLCAQTLLPYLAPLQQELSNLFELAANDLQQRDVALSGAHEIIHSVAAKIRPHEFDAVFGDQDTSGLNREQRRRLEQLRMSVMGASVPDLSPGVRLLKYIALMSTVWFDWRRITMIPNQASVGLNIQPGGLVICEDGPDYTWFTSDQLETIAMIAGAGMSHIEIANAQVQGNQKNREAAMGLVSHEFQRRSAAIRQALKPDSTTDELRRANSALDRISRINEASYHVMCGTGHPLRKSELRQYLDSDVEHIRSLNNCANTDISVELEDVSIVDIRVYMIAAEILRNAGQHICDPGTEFRREDETALVTLRIASGLNGIEIACESGPHELSLSDPECHFRQPANDRRPRKGIPLIWSMASQLIGQASWEAIPDAMQNLERNKGRFRVLFRYAGPSRVER
jgi:hypothetical protein